METHFALAQYFFVTSIGFLIGLEIPLVLRINRRFAPLALKMAEFWRDRQEPLTISYRVNAGFLPPDHWTQDPRMGGGRIVGEGWHFVDLVWIFLFPVLYLL